LIWSVGGIPRDDFKQSDNQKVVFSLTVLCCLDGVLTPQKGEFVDKAEKVKGMEGAGKALESIARTYGHTFFNTSLLDFPRLMDDPANVAGNLRFDIAGFSPDVLAAESRFSSTESPSSTGGVEETISWESI
ncbi:MAG: hypothetical protein GXP36_03255, partial [Actinobacteria bacterium]|nr:hypothetical protein [Actinomycetota bacterium]